jgi:hypothetical protein
MAANGEKIPIMLQLDGSLIDGAVVKPISFANFGGVVEEARLMKDPKTWEGKLRRARMAKQVAFYANGTVVDVSIFDLTKLSIQSARTLIDLLDRDDGPQGKVIRPGDGIEKAIIYELGTPIRIQNKDPIKELEFIAKNYGDVEDIMASVDPIEQANLLIANLAKPLGTTLTTLPSWAVAQITLGDGLTIVRDVLPPFLGTPPAS